MPLGVITEHQRSQTHISNDEIRQIITQQYPLLAATDNTAMQQNPFPEGEAEPKSLHFFFVDGEPKINWDALERVKAASERYQLIGKVFYLHGCV